MATKKSSKTQKAKPRGRVKALAVTQRPTYAEVCQHLAESLQRENATSDVLHLIASSAKNLQTRT